MKIIGICGSDIVDGTTEKFLRRALQAVSEIDGMDVDDIMLRGDSAEARARQLIEIAQAVIFATPVHWFNMSASMKSLIDSLPADPPWPLQYKIAGFIAVCDEDGAQQAMSQMMSAVNYMGMIIPPWACLIHNTSMNGGQDNWQNEPGEFGREFGIFVEDYLKD